MNMISISLICRPIPVQCTLYSYSAQLYTNSFLLKYDFIKEMIILKIDTITAPICVIDLQYVVHTCTIVHALYIVCCRPLDYIQEPV